MKNRWMLLAASFVLFGFHQENGCGGEEPEVCPAVLCALACPNGYVVDENGCSTCECVPAPSCEELGESECGARSDCVAEYGALCDAAPCPPGDDSCFRIPCEPSFLGCRERGPCEGLDEGACSADPQCEAIYEWTVCDAAPCPPDDPSCFVPPPCDPIGTYVGCQLRDPCAGLDEQACLADPACEPRYEDVVCYDGGIRAPCQAQYSGCHTAGQCGTPEPVTGD